KFPEIAAIALSGDDVPRAREYFPVALFDYQAGHLAGPKVECYLIELVFDGCAILMRALVYRGGRRFRRPGAIRNSMVDRVPHRRDVLCNESNPLLTDAVVVVPECF